MRCNSCGRFLVSNRQTNNDEFIGPPFTKDVKGLICKDCSHDLDKNGNFKEEL